MANIQSNWISMEYEIEGPADAPVLLLIHGLGPQLTRWPRGLCEKFLAAGFRVLRIDNRDVGLSSHMNEAGIPDIAEVTAAAAQGRTPEIPYTLSDMARDAIGVLDFLGIDQVACRGGFAGRNDHASSGDRAGERP